MTCNEELLQSVLSALTRLQGREDEVPAEDLRELDSLAWRIHDDVVGGSPQ